MSLTPSLPQRWRQPKGSIPLTPIHFLTVFSSVEKLTFLWFFANLLSGYRIMGDTLAAGAEAKVAVAPKSVRNKFR